MSDTALVPTPFLRLALLGDAIASGAMGLLLTLAAGQLAPWLGLPEPLLRGVGLLLLPYAVSVAWIGSRAQVSRLAVRSIIAINLVWVVGSLLILVFGHSLAGLAPRALGVAFVAAQALVVAGFAALQAMALRRQGLRHGTGRRALVMD